MSNLSKLVNVQISRQTAGVTQAGFGLPLVLGPNGFGGEIREYSDAPAAAADLPLSSPEYLLIQKIFSQTPRPEKVKLGKTSTPVAQVVTFEPTIESGLEEAQVQKIVLAPVPASGDFTLSFGGNSTATIAFNATANDIQTALRLVAGLENVTVEGTIGTELLVTMTGLVSPTLLTVGSNTLEDDSSQAVVITVTEESPYVPAGAQLFKIAIGDSEYEFLSDTTPTINEVVDGLKAEINGDANAVVIASGTTELIVTSKIAGNPFVVTEVSSNITFETTTPSNGIQEDILAARDIDDDWYFLHTASQDATTVENAAALIESLRKLYVFRNNEASARTNSQDNIIGRLVAKQYFRSVPFYHTLNSTFADGALVGRVAPLDPGSETWANKTLAAVPADKFTDSEEAQLDNKNANYYVNVGGINVTQNGKVCGGEYIDIIRFIDWLQARMEEGIFQDIANADKIPFTDGGIAVVENRMREVLKRGVRAGGIVSEQDFTVTVPRAKDIPLADKAARRLTGIKFTAVLSGAIHAVSIQGTVTL